MFSPYGVCRNSPPYPTDKLFTGQRLDDTGLYYYNARYYDATIGRFISPDTVVQSPANPQTLNRYSYCLNNPLRYIDPSGHIVKFEYDALIEYMFSAGIEVPPEILQPWLALHNAFSTLGEAAPEITKVMEDTDKVITIGCTNDMDTNYGAGTVPDYPDWNESTDENGNYVPKSFKVNINSSQTGDVISLAGILAHEFFHILADLNGCTYKATNSNGDNIWVSDWRFEEALAYSYQAQVLKALGVDGTGTGYNSDMVNTFGWLSPYLLDHTLLDSAAIPYVRRNYPTTSIYPRESSGKTAALMLIYYICFP